MEKCINCKNEINPGGIVCPYCHGNPMLFGDGPYIPPTEYDPIAAGVTLGAIGGLVAAVASGPVGAIIITVAALRTIWGLIK